jgi:hypothetical protein
MGQKIAEKLVDTGLMNINVQFMISGRVERRYGARLLPRFLK